MRSFYRWVFEHTFFCRTLLFFVLAGFTVYALSFPYVDFLTIYLVDLALWFVVGRFIATAPFKLMKEPQRILNEDCDPYPMLEEIGHQLSREFDGPQRQLLEIDQAVAYRDIGEYQKAAQLLEGINIDKFPGLTPFSKYVYYHNLADICYVVGNIEEARIWTRKFRQIYHDLPMTKYKQTLTATHDLMEAEILYYEGDYEKALRKVAWIQLNNKRQVLDGAFLAAKCHMALEEPEKAREKLQYIVDNGNKLYIVQEAQQLLDTLN